MILYQTTLPFPPSVNGLYGGGSGQKRFPSKKYKAWLAQCPELEKLKISDEVHLILNFAWPDKRSRDLTNYVKAVEDYLVNQEVLMDDNYYIVKMVSLRHSGVQKDCPRVDVTILRA